MKLVTNKFKSGGLHEKHLVATWNLGHYMLLMCVHCKYGRLLYLTSYKCGGSEVY